MSTEGNKSTNSNPILEALESLTEDAENWSCDHGGTVEPSPEIRERAELIKNALAQLSTVAGNLQQLIQLLDAGVQFFAEKVDKFSVNIQLAGDQETQALYSYALAEVNGAGKALADILQCVGGSDGKRTTINDIFAGEGMTWREAEKQSSRGRLIIPGR